MNEKGEVELFALPLHPGVPCRKGRHVSTRCVGEQPHDLGPMGTGHPVTPVKGDEEQHCSHRETLEILPLQPPPPTSLLQLCRAPGNT